MPIPDKIIIDFPALPALGALPAVLGDAQVVRESLIFALYGRHKITLKEARLLLGLSRREFEERLPEFGLSMMTEEDLEDELAGVAELKKKYKQ